MAVRRTGLISVIFLATCCLWLACAETTRYRVLSIFFEGVPRPGEPASSIGLEQAEHEPPGDVAGTDEVDKPPEQRVALTDAVRVHPPYVRGRCGSCHAPDGGLAMRTPQEGLCSQCHNIPGDLLYIHGPVAVSDCLFCHHHHGGGFPKMLLAEAKDVCLRCHKQGLTVGEHHAHIDETTCTDCHHAHGGDNRLFVKPDKP